MSFVLLLFACEFEVRVIRSTDVSGSSVSSIDVPKLNLVIFEEFKTNHLVYLFPGLLFPGFSTYCFNLLTRPYI